MDNMFIWKVTVKDTPVYSEYWYRFIVAAPSIPETIEEIYQWWKADRDEEDKEDAIPFYLRSTNLKFEKVCGCDLTKNLILSKDGYFYD